MPGEYLVMDMQVWFSNLLYLIIGAILGGVFPILGDWLRHLRLRKEVTQNRLIDGRLSVFQELTKRLSKLRFDTPFLHGIEVFRWPKDRRISPQYYETPDDANVKQSAELAMNFDAQIEELKEFVTLNNLFLGNKVATTFWYEFGKLAAIRSTIRVHQDHKLPDDITNIMQTALNSLIDGVGNAISKELNVPGFDVPLVRDIHGKFQEGLQVGFAQVRNQNRQP